MRKILLFLIPLFFGVLISNAQFNKPQDAAALQLVSANKVQLGLSAEDLNNVIVSNTYLDNASGIRMVYLQQTYKGVPVYNQLIVLAFKNNQLVSNAGVFNHSMEKLANSKTGIPSLSPEAAVQSALSDRKLVATQMAVAISRKNNGQKIEFGNMGVSRENITAQLLWAPVDETVKNITAVTKIKLAWQVYIIPKTTSDYWLVKVDATDNSILGMDNLTVYDNWGKPELPQHINILENNEFGGNAANNNIAGNNLFDFKAIANLDTESPNSPSIVNSATYRVIPFPAESPIHPGGAHALRTDPWTAAPGNATTLKWHTGTGGTNYDYSRGNNVWAYEDRTAPANTGTVAKSAPSTTTPDPLTFNYTPDLTVAPTQTTPVQNQQFNITNLFYWNNVIHDVMYVYGFTEAAANFQDDNQGRGGVGNDHVNAEAQDAGGTNNANFATPADGGSGRMQMYLWTLSTPQRDGDVDNGIVVHEFGHGISNRLTGGGVASCLGNAEQMGEGWSDYYSLMFTQDWSTATLATGFNSPRGIGTYALNQPITGLGIRSQKYCTDFTVNNKVYAASIPAAPHDRGEIWCATLWDMTWNIINQVGTINANLYNLAGGGGNTIAMKLVTEGLRLQQCSPGFISSRNAILQADQALYGGQYNCAIWEAFRRRGMGAFASEGSTNSVTDQIADFTPPLTLAATQNGITAVNEGQNIIYANKLTTCSPITGYTLTDTLPSNVTYVSGGTYNAGNRVVSFTANQGAGTTSYPFTVSVNLGSYFPPVTLLNETVAGATIPATWTTTATPGNVWSVVSTQSSSAPNSFFVENLVTAADQKLETTSAIALPANSYPRLTFKHRYNTEDGWDGGVVEISTNGGATWTDLGANMTSGGYNGGLGAGVGNNLSGRAAFTGTSVGAGLPVTTVIGLAAYAGQSVKIRFRFASDDNTAGTGSPTGWWVDDIVLDAVAAVNMRTSLFNASNVRVSFKDTVTLINPLVLCAPNITTQPTSTTVCASSPASFTCVANATGGVTYQWQVSTNGGGSWSDIAGATTSTYSFTALIAQNGNLFRCVITGSCPPNANSQAATLTVVAASVGGTLTPANTPVCGTPNNGTLTLSGNTGAIVRWEFSTNGGGTWTNIANTTNTQTFTNVTTTTQYRVLVQVPGCTAVYSAIGTVTFTASSALTIISDVPTTLCQGDPALLTVVGLTSSAFSSATALTIPGTGTGASTGAPANPYPSTLAVAGLPATGVSVKSVTLSGISHTFPSDMDIALVSPTGQVVVLMSDIGGGTDLTGQNYTFDDAATLSLTTALNPTGTYKPTNLGGTVDPFPGGPTTGTTSLPLSTFTGNPNGNWQLYAVDDLGGDIGAISGGFSITFNATGIVPGLTYTWTPGTGLNQTTGNPVAAAPATTTTYTVFADNGAGCVRQASITLNVNARPAITSQPANTTICSGTLATFTVTATGAGITYQWQESTNGGTTYTNLNNTAPYSGVTTATLTINPTTPAMANYRYRCVVSGICLPNAVSNAGILNVTALPVVPITPAGPVCGGIAGINGTMLTAGSALPPVPGSATFTSGAINVAIPEGVFPAPPTTAGANTIAVSGIPANATITNISVTSNITHAYVGDVVMVLKAPNGAVFNLDALLNKTNNAGANFLNTVISSAGVTTLDLGTAPFTGTFKADAVGATFVAFGSTLAGGPVGYTPTTTSWNGLYSTPNGNWTIAAYDAGAPDVGSFTSWSIKIDYTTPGASGSPLTYTWSPATGLFTDPSAIIPYIAGTPLATVYAAPTTLTTYTVSGTDATTGCVGTSSVIVNYTPPAPTVTPSAVTMCLGYPAVLLKSSSSTTTTASFPSGTINLAVPDNTANGVNNSVTVSGIPANATITNVAVKLNMSHTYPGDMIFNLRGPSGQILNLYKYAGGAFTGPVSGVSTWGWYNATVSATTGTAFNTVAVAPFIYGASPTWRADLLNTVVAGTTVQNPTGFVSNATSFTNLFTTTTSANAAWTLAMADGGAGDVGSLASWSLEITYVVGVPATPAVWTPIAGLFSNAAATTAYVAGTAVDSVWVRPSASGVYPYVATVQSLGLPPSAIATTFTNNNQFALVTSNFKNNNSFPVTITGIESVAATAGGSTARLYYKVTPVNGAPGAISAANGWTLAGSGTYTAIANTTTTTPQPMLGGLSLVVPPGATYGLAFESQITGGAGNLRYSTVAAGTYTNSAGGCDLVSGSAASFAGDLAPIAPTFNPRAFIGRVLFSGATAPPCTSPGRTVIVTVNDSIKFNPLLPANAAVCTDKVTSFTVAATGTSIQHNWQVSINNGNIGSWTNIVNGGVYGGANTATLTITAPPVSMNGYLYRDSIHTTGCRDSISRIARLTVNPLPTITLGASRLRIFPGLTSTIFSTVSPIGSTFTWFRNGLQVPGSTGSLVVNADGLGDYRLRVTDVNGCTNTSGIITIADSASGKVFIYPNPNTGLFQVRYYSSVNTIAPRGINVYDARGKRIITQTYAITAPYSRMDVDLSNHGSGLYMVEVVDVDGNRLAIGKVEVLR
jgi:subtilisin-like proprotein convertase family protein